MTNSKPNIEVIANDVYYIRKGMDKICKRLDKFEEKYVTKVEQESELKRIREENKPVKLIAYGLITVLSSTVVGYLLVRIVNGGGG